MLKFSTRSRTNFDPITRGRSFLNWPLKRYSRSLTRNLVCVLIIIDHNQFIHSSDLSGCDANDHDDDALQERLAQQELARAPWCLRADSMCVSIIIRALVHSNERDETVEPVTTVFWSVTKFDQEKRKQTENTMISLKFDAWAHVGPEQGFCLDSPSKFRAKLLLDKIFYTYIQRVGVELGGGCTRQRGMEDPRKIGILNLDGRNLDSKRQWSAGGGKGEGLARYFIHFVGGPVGKFWCKWVWLSTT